MHVMLFKSLDLKFTHVVKFTAFSNVILNEHISSKE